MKLLFRRKFIHCTVVLFSLQIASRKVRNLWIGVNKLVGKVLINLLHHTKFIMSHKVSHLCNQHNYQCTFWLSCWSCTPKQTDLTSGFVTTAALLRQHAIVVLGGYYWLLCIQWLHAVCLHVIVNSCMKWLNFKRPWPLPDIRPD